MKIVSACLAGFNCRFDRTNRLNEYVKKLIERGEAIPVCPEQLGGLPVPRLPAEQIEGKVYDKEGKDVTENFIIGACEVLRIAQNYGCKEAILKSNSPSCGSGQIYDGTFTRTLIKGDGITTALLKKNGIKVYTEENFK